MQMKNDTEMNICGLQLLLTMLLPLLEKGSFILTPLHGVTVGIVKAAKTSRGLP